MAEHTHLWEGLLFKIVYILFLLYERRMAEHTCLKREYYSLLRIVYIVTGISEGRIHLPTENISIPISYTNYEYSTLTLSGLRVTSL